MNKNAALFVVTGIIALAVLFLLFKPAAPPQEKAEPTVSSAPQAQPAPAQAPEPVIRVFEWQVAQGKLVSGPEAAQVKQGEHVTLKITSDHADEVHLHGYDLEAKLKAGETAALSFEAVHTGRFDLELHHAHLELGALEVLPQ